MYLTSGKKKLNKLRLSTSVRLTVSKLYAILLYTSDSCYFTARRYKSEISKNDIFTRLKRYRHCRQSNRFVCSSSAPHLCTINTAGSFFSVIKAFLPSPPSTTSSFFQLSELSNMSTLTKKNPQRQVQRSITNLFTQGLQTTTGPFLASFSFPEPKYSSEIVAFSLKWIWKWIECAVLGNLWHSVTHKSDYSCRRSAKVCSTAPYWEELLRSHLTPRRPFQKRGE